MISMIKMIWQRIYWDILKQSKAGIPAMLDSPVKKVWDNALFDFSNGAPINQVAIDKIYLDIENKIRYDQQALQDYLW